MQTLVLDHGDSSYIINAAHIARSSGDVSADLAASVMSDWEIDKSNPFVTWIAGNFVEGDKANSNKQFWTAGDLELAEYSIKYAPLNMVHKFRAPVGFYAATKNVKLERPALTVVDDSKLNIAVSGGGGGGGFLGGSTVTLNPSKITTINADTAAAQASMKIEALAGLWSHLFPFETAQVQLADEQGLLFFSMECRGTHLTCAGEDGCGATFEYSAADTHCEHLQQRTSIRHIVNPTFRGGALIVPPTNPGWKEAKATVVTESVMSEAAVFAEQNEAAYRALEADGVTMTAAGWEQLMSLVVASATKVPTA